jgi:transcription-repair coupling factor (superfamily II helicase)
MPRFDGGAGALASPLDIKAGDFLVHEKHGIGRYQRLQSLKVGKDTSEYLNIEYKGGDRIYVPIFELQQVQKYMGAEGRRPALSSLDTASWEKLKSKVKEDVAKLAAELLKKAARRAAKLGHAFPPAAHLEKEFAESFVYELTEDQKKTWQEVEADMMAPKAMDRLVCGDVGFGKTEIAMRAALKCALAGKQVAFLCPTTILAEQHARNFTERFADYPVTVSFVSRFQTKLEQKEILKQIASGGVDVIIGTHRLLSSDVVFKNVGLVIIDEEHRFGVRQKSKLLAFRETVDVLSLTATPIPRTLSASLGGIKDLSVIETAPEGRLPISTRVGVFDEDVMVKAVQAEFDRGGQVFYVHNRVKTLLARKKWLETVLPGVRIGMVHGQMKENELEEAMHGFLHRKIDLLLATTIIESGLDIPSVNTLIVEEAEELGLAQLYQLRGRVGRSRTRASCYLFYSLGGMTADAKRRLEALREFTALGSGFRLAMRDMEIRGAGNLLGPQQHGNMAAVGIETYSRLLNEEIHRQKSGVIDEDVPQEMVLEVSLTAFLPDDYLPSESERVQMYKRILAANEALLTKLKEELIDRCGPLPSPAKTLFDAAHLRLLAQAKGIVEIHQETDDVVFYFRPRYELPENSFQRLLAENDKLWRFIPGPPVGVRVFQEDGEGPLDTIGRFLRAVFPQSVDVGK